MYGKFKHPNNSGLYAFIEAPVVLLLTEVPEIAVHSKKEDGSQKTVAEYLTLAPLLSVDGTTCIILLNELLPYRNLGVDEANLARWDEFATPLGVGSTTWLTLDEYRERKASSDYPQEEI